MNTSSMEKPTDLKALPAREMSSHMDDVEIGEIREIGQLDEAEDFLRENNFSHAQVKDMLEDEQRGKKLVRKIDLMIMPLLCCTYVLQYVDKQCLSYAAVFDLLTNTHMTTDQYAWLTTVFYLGYLVAEYPWSYAAQRWSISKVVAGCV